MWPILFAGLSLGLISSFHCVGMCGPLALALPVRHLSGAGQNLALVLYNSGRVATYATLGLIFGLAGRRLYVAGWQQWFSIVAGIFILFIALQYFLFRKRWQPAWLQAFYQAVQGWMARFLKSRKISAFFLLGMANGLLPCGMVYLAIAGALTSQQVMAGMFFMIAFGLGTIPAMMALSFFGWRINIRFRQRINGAIPYIMGLVAAILILRGLNLGIPFISPVLAHAPGTASGCH